MGMIPRCRVSIFQRVFNRHEPSGKMVVFKAPENHNFLFSELGENVEFFEIDVSGRGQCKHNIVVPKLLVPTSRCTTPFFTDKIVKI